MINVPVGFKDAHGVVYNEGVILINHISHTAQTSMQTNLQVEAGVPSYVFQTNPFNAQLGFTAVIYPSAQALAENRPPLLFRPENIGDYFNIPLAGPLEESELVNTCEQWLLTHVLNSGSAPV